MIPSVIYKLRKTLTQKKRRKGLSKRFSKIRKLSPKDPLKDKSKFKGTKLSSYKPKRRPI